MIVVSGGVVNEGIILEIKRCLTALTPSKFASFGFGKKVHNKKGIISRDNTSLVTLGVLCLLVFLVWKGLYV